MFHRAKLDLEAVNNSSFFDKLDQQSKAIFSSLVSCTEKTEEMNAGFKALIQVVRRLESNTEEAHRVTRNKIAALLREAKPEAKSDPMEDITASFEVMSVSARQEKQLRRAITQDILGSLSFPSMTNRYEDLVNAHPTTLEWAFSDPTFQQKPWSNLSRWLKDGKGIYWVNGKAGSGKSTLMKHISGDQRTSDFLQIWATGKGNCTEQKSKHCVASFFFWNSGTREQKSQIGLLRALLYQVLQTDDSLAAILWPEVWAQSYINLVTESTELGEDDAAGQVKAGMPTWSLSCLMKAFQTLARQQTVPLKVCFLIDGLDEFEGNHYELADLLIEMAHNSNIKICVSSRPWVEFIEKFSECPSLRLQDLTYPDIEKYVHGKAGRHQAFQKLADREPLAASSLLNEIIESADGVFLWVRIVVHSLLDGIVKRDNTTILLERLRKIPRELAPLYQYLLTQISEHHLQWASKAFQLVRTSETLDPQTPIPLSLLKLHFAVSEDETFFQVTGTKHEKLVTACEDTEIHLIARCAGLLELHSGKDNFSGVPYLNSSVEYLHRTAREYVENENTWPIILSHTKKTNFNVHVSLMKACTLLIQTWDFTHNRHNNDGLVQTARGAMQAAPYADDCNETQEFQAGILQSLDRQMSQIFTPNWPFLSEFGLPEFNTKMFSGSTFLAFAGVLGLRGYIRYYLTMCKFEASQVATEILAHLMSKSWERSQRKGFFSPDLSIPLPGLVELLLTFGAHADLHSDHWRDSRLWDWGSPWDSALVHLSTSRYSSRSYLEIVQLLLFSGPAPAIRRFCTSFTPVEDTLRTHCLPWHPNVTKAIIDEAKSWNRRSEKHRNCRRKRASTQEREVKRRRH